MTTYIESLPTKKYVSNIVILLSGKYFSMAQPDSGLVVDSDKVGLVKSLVVNPTTIDPSRASTTISSISFSLLDKNGVVSSLFSTNLNYLTGQEARVFLGRLNTSMPFSDYQEMPRTLINKVSKSDGAWNFSCQETKDRLNKSAFSKSSKLFGDILAATTIIRVLNVSLFPSTGLVKIDKEFISYSGVDLVNNDLTGCVRGLRGTTATGYPLGTDVNQAGQIKANPINILISLLVSNGGGGVYDTLGDGAKILSTLVDIAQMEDVREQFFAAYDFDLSFSNLSSLVQFIETEILYPLGLRLRTNLNSKIGLAVLNRTYFNIDVPDITHGSITRNPNFEVTNSKIFNRIRVRWDWSENSAMFLQSYDLTDSSSIALYGEFLLTVSTKGPLTANAGAAQIQDIAAQFLKRFASANPEISFATHMDSSLALIGDKVKFVSSLVLDVNTGTLGLDKNLEVISRAINHATGDVSMRLSFTWYSSIRECFIAPNDTVAAVVSQSRLTLSPGRTDLYRIGWVLTLWNIATNNYAEAGTRTILDIIGNDLIFNLPWTAATAITQKIKFANYDEVHAQQKKYCFIGCGSEFISDGGEIYQITC